MIYYLTSGDLTILLTTYSKTDQTNIPAAEIARILKDELGG